MQWRSLLFIPVLEQRFVAKAAERGADAVVLDLEASILPDRKAEARAALAKAVDHLSGRVDVTVRINAFGLQAVRDLEAAVIAGVSSLHLALCRSADEVRAIDRIVTDLESERGLPEGRIGLVPMLETPEAVLVARQIAKAARRVRALTLGVEDYATAMGVDATPEVLRPAAVQVIQAAKSVGRDALVVPHSMADYADLDALDEAARYARAIGSTCGYAVHPTQIAVLNQVFGATAEEIERSRKIVAAAEAAERAGDGIVKVDGRMIDAPLVARARKVIARTAGENDRS
ncbi:MAG: aldolase/citrate lyase family protein [Pseudomonadota bacterium]